MLLALVAIGGVFVLGLGLSLWAVYHREDRRRPGGLRDRILKSVERLGNGLVYLSLLIPVGYGLFRLPETLQFWIVAVMLVSGLFLMIFTLTNLVLAIVKNILVVVTRSPLTRVTTLLAYGVAYLVFLAAGVLLLDGLVLLCWILIYKI